MERKQKPVNPEETMRMLYALSGDERYLENIDFMVEGDKSMCDLLDAMVNKGISQEISQGIGQGINQGIEALVITCREFNAGFAETAAKVKERFHLSDEEVEKNMQLYWK